MRRFLTRPRLFAGAVLTMLVFGVSVAGGAGVDPASYSATLNSGDSVTITKTVHTPDIPPNPDLVFLADTTGSMGSAIANVKANAGSVMTQVATAQPTSEFGVAQYKDFNCDAVPYHLDQAITSNQANVQTAINTWSASGGCDTPESAINALYQLATSPATGWRTGSSRIIAWFGDAPSHDPSNGITEAMATAALVAANIRVIAISSGFDQLDQFGQATRITNATGGVLLHLSGSSSNDISAAILAGLGNLPATVTHAATCDAGLSSTFDLPSITVTSGDDAVFHETIHVASNAPDGGTLHCTVHFLINGVPSDDFVQQVDITVPLRATDLSLTKTASPSSVTEGGNVTYTLTATNNGTDPDTNVSATDPLPAGESFVSGDPGCSAAANIVTCDFGTLAPGASASKSFVVNVALGAPSTLTNTATVTGDRPESHPGDNSSTTTVNVNHNPLCGAATAGPDLWPPNHKWVWSSITGVTDPDGGTISVTITGIWQDEPTNGLGDGDTAVDGQIGSGNTFAVRAERSGTGDGRVYTIYFTATDGSGGSCTGSATIGVPHDQGNGSTPINGGALYDSTL
jgi:uncharacterized repeat protein (TIGR01451 family)